MGSKVDYGAHHKDRHKMVNYLRLSSCRSLSPKEIYELKVRRRRIILALAALAVLTIGVYYVVH